MIHFIMHCIQINKKNKNFELIFSTYNRFCISKMLFNNIIIICKNNSEVRNVKMLQFLFSAAISMLHVQKHTIRSQLAMLMLLNNLK